MSILSYRTTNVYTHANGPCLCYDIIMSKKGTYAIIIAAALVGGTTLAGLSGLYQKSGTDYGGPPWTQAISALYESPYAFIDKETDLWSSKSGMCILPAGRTVTVEGWPFYFILDDTRCTDKVVFGYPFIIDAILYAASLTTLVFIIMKRSGAKSI